MKALTNVTLEGLQRLRREGNYLEADKLYLEWLKCKQDNTKMLKREIRREKNKIHNFKNRKKKLKVYKEQQY